MEWDAGAMEDHEDDGRAHPGSVDGRVLGAAPQIEGTGAVIAPARRENETGP